MDAAEATIARRACLAVMVSAEGADGCALAMAGIEIKTRDATVARFPEMRFTVASSFETER
jgi:hypothetical protein